jgi:hypothetical protein
MKKVLIIGFVLMCSLACGGLKVPAPVEPEDAVRLMDVSDIVAPDTPILERDTERAEAMTLGKKIHILLMGQSNAEGAPERQTYLMPIDYSYYPSSTNYPYLDGVTNAWLRFFVGTNRSAILTGAVRQKETREWGVEIPLAHYLTQHAGTTVYITKVAQGATQLCNSQDSLPTSGVMDTWAPNEVTYGNIFSNIGPSVANMISNYPAAGAVDVVIWIQGESDANNSTEANLYYRNLTNLQKQVRTVLTNQSLPWVVCGLNTTYMIPNGLIVRDAIRQVAATDTNTTYLEAYDLPLVHGTSPHFSGEGYWMYGKRLVGAVRGALSKQATVDGGLDVKGALNARHGHFNHELYGSTIRGNVAEIDTISDQFGTLSTLAISAESLQFYFDVSRTNVFDLAEKQTAGTIGSKTNYTVSSNWYSRGVSFNGVITNSAATLATGTNRQFTLSFWIKTVGGTDGDGFIGSLLNSSGGHLMSIYCGMPQGSVRSEIKISTNRSTAPVYNTRDFWSHVVWTYTAESGSQTNYNVFYMNGQKCNDFTDALTGFTGYVSLGGNLPAGADHDVGLDDMMLFNRALRPEEVVILYNAQSRGMTGVRGL